MPALRAGLKHLSPVPVALCASWVRYVLRAPAVVISGVAAVCDVWDGSIPGACAPPPSERVFGRPVGTPPVRGEAALARRETLAVDVVGLEEHDIQ